MAVSKRIRVEVAYASVTKQHIIPIDVAPGSTIAEAIKNSGILEDFPEIDLSKQQIGVFSKARTLQDKVKEGDRIEIYRALIIDPKEARRVKARKV
jgi:putative ubiquitin-RnfH superfamily antitoxin RatB of RatAB toxin-antitoxin module